MHLNNNAIRETAHRPIQARDGEAVTLEGDGMFDIARAVAWIGETPDIFTLVSLPLKDLQPEIRRRGKFNFHYIAIMSHADCRRPILMGTRPDGGRFLLDGRHRAARSSQLGYPTVDAWILTSSQTQAIRLE